MPKTAAQARPENLKHTLRCLLSYMGHAKISLGIVSVLAVVSALANLLGTYMINPVVTALTTGHADRLGSLIALTAIIYALGVACALGYTQIMVRAAQRVVFDIRRDLFAHIQTLPLAYFDRTRAGDIMSFFTNDVDTVSEALNNSFATVIQAAVQTVGTLVLMFVLNWCLGADHCGVRRGHRGARALFGHAQQEVVRASAKGVGCARRLYRGDGLGAKSCQGLQP